MKDCEDMQLKPYRFQKRSSVKRFTQRLYLLAARGLEGLVELDLHTDRRRSGNRSWCWSRSLGVGGEAVCPHLFSPALFFFKIINSLS